MRRLLPLLAAASVVAACMPESATREGRSIESLYAVVLVLALIVAATVWGLITFAILRFRRRRGRGSEPSPDELPPQIGGHVGLEALWTLVPLLTIFGIFGLTLVTLDQVEQRSAAAPVELRVEAFRWGWRIGYPAAGVEIVGIGEPGPEAVLPVGQTVRVTLTSVDVIHSFYVPQFLYKRDAVPGQSRVFDLTIEQPGVYAGQCAEFCGLLHARMPFTVRAVDAAEFEAWLAGQAGAQP